MQWGQLDVLIVDLPPGTGDVQMTLTQKAEVTGAIIVSTPQDVALLDARKAVNMFQKMNTKIFGMIENMSMYICPNCGHEAHIFGHGGAKADAERLGLPFLGEIPLDLEIRTAADGGAPIVAAKPQSPQAQAFPHHRPPVDRRWHCLKTRRPTPRQAFPRCFGGWRRTIRSRPRWPRHGVAPIRG